MTAVFREVRERVSAEDAAHRYGLTFDRKGWALCPFHADTKPSLSFKNGRFRCWACGASGDAVDLTKHLFVLSPLEAAERLILDFGLNIPIREKTTPEQAEAVRRQHQIAEAHQQFEEWRRTFTNSLNEAFRAGHVLLKNFPEHLSDSQATAIQMHETLEYWADTLMHGTPEEQAEIFREREAIRFWIDKILKN